MASTFGASLEGRLDWEVPWRGERSAVLVGQLADAVIAGTTGRWAEGLDATSTSASRGLATVSTEAFHAAPHRRRHVVIVVPPSTTSTWPVT